MGEYEKQEEIIFIYPVVLYQYTLTFYSGTSYKQMKGFCEIIVILPTIMISVYIYSQNILTFRLGKAILHFSTAICNVGMNLCQTAFRGGILDSDLIQSCSNWGGDPLMHLRAILLHLQTQSQPGHGQRWALWQSEWHNSLHVHHNLRWASFQK